MDLHTARLSVWRGGWRLLRWLPSRQHMGTYPGSGGAGGPQPGPPHNTCSAVPQPSEPLGFPWLGVGWGRVQVGDKKLSCNLVRVKVMMAVFH